MANFADTFFDVAFRVPGSYHEWVSEGSWLAFLHVPEWPRGMRRLFVLTLPLACILWVATGVVTALGVFALWVAIVIGLGGVLALLLCAYGIGFGLTAVCRSLWS